ncbi:MAG: hypothetical protein ACE5OS_08480 [Anaerolineae bacterium]
MHKKKGFVQLLVALLIGLTGVMGTLLLLSQEADARPMLDEVNLLISKSASADHVQIGEQLVYTLTYQNTSTDTAASGVLITDTLDSNVTYVTASPTPDGGTAENAPYWNISTISESTSGTIVLTVTVAAPLTNGTVLTNIAIIDSEQTTPASDDVTTTVDAPTLELTKRDYSDPVPTGAPLTYTLAYTNTGDATAANVVITDVLDSNVTYLSASLSPTGWTTPTLYWDIGVLTPSIPGEIVLSVTVQSGLGEGTILTNSAAIDSQETNPSSVTEETAVISHGVAVSVTLTPTATIISAGQSISYTLIAHDAYGNDWDVTHSGSYTITLDAGGSWASNVYTSQVAGTWTITGTYDGKNDTATLTVNPGPLDYFAFGNISDQTAGIAFTVAITAYDTFANLKSDYPGPATLSDSTGTITPTSTGNFTAGEWSGSVTITRTGSAVVITAKDASVSSDSNSFTVHPAELHHILLSPPTSTIFAWQVQTYTVEAFDVYSNSRGDVTTQTTFSIVESGHGGYWTDNVYNPKNPGDWTVQAVYTGTRVTTDTGSLTVRTPVLHLDKSDNPDDNVEAGDHLTYTLTYSNTGNMTATGVVVTDTLDPNVAYVTASPAPSGGLPDAPFWSIADVAPGQLGQITVTVAVTSPLPNGTMLTNTAWLDADQPVSVSATETTTVHSSPVLTITKTDYPDPVSVGGLLRYTIVITNSGNENATSITVTEGYDPDIVFQSANPDPDAGSENRVWTFPTLAVDTSESIDVFVQVTDTIAGGTVLTNEATLDSAQTVPISTTEATYVQPKSKLEVTQSDIPDPVQAGATLVYSILYENNGTAGATNVVITDTYDSRVTYLSASPPPDAGNNVWYTSTLPAGGSGTILVQVRVDTPLPNGTLLNNVVTVSSDEETPPPFIETTEVSSAPVLTYTLTDQSDPVEAGASLTYTLRYTNTGNADATQVVVTATLDSYVSFSSSTPAPTGGGGDVRYWELGTIAGKDNDGNVGSREIVIHANVTLPLTNGTTLSFTMQLRDAEGDSLEDTITTTVKSAPVLSFDKSDGVSTVYADDLLTYTLTYTNSGNENGYDITITDTLPVSYTQYVGCEISDGTCQHVPADGEVIFHIPIITAPTSSQAQLVVQIDDPLPAGADFVTNTARMTAPCLPAPIDAQDVDHIGTLPDLIITAVHEPNLFSPGKLMTYTLTYSNTGQMDAEDIVITTVLPTGTVYEGYDWNSSGGQTYTYQVGNLPAGSPVYTIRFTVRHNDSAYIGEPEFNTPFTIAETGSAGGDANPGDNTAYVYIGVPDLVVLDFTAGPLPPESNMPITFTVVLKNQGTGEARNPDPGGAGFWVDVFIAPVPSYPFTRWGECYEGSEPIAPGSTTQILIVCSFTEEQIQDIEAFYVKVDNHADAIYDEEGHFVRWERLYGLVPEHNEMNNLGGPIDPWFHRIYLPLTLKSQ